MAKKLSVLVCGVICACFVLIAYTAYVKTPSIFASDNLGEESTKAQLSIRNIRSDEQYARIYVDVEINNPTQITFTNVPLNVTVSNSAGVVIIKQDISAGCSAKTQQVTPYTFILKKPENYWGLPGKYGNPIGPGGYINVDLNRSLLKKYKNNPAFLLNSVPAIFQQTTVQVREWLSYCWGGGAASGASWYLSKLYAQHIEEIERLKEEQLEEVKRVKREQLEEVSKRQAAQSQALERFDEAQRGFEAAQSQAQQNQVAENIQRLQAEQAQAQWDQVAAEAAANKAAAQQDIWMLLLGAAIGAQSQPRQFVPMPTMQVPTLGTGRVIAPGVPTMGTGVVSSPGVPTLGMGSTNPFARTYTMTPKGTYVGGDTYTMAPNGAYVGGKTYTMAPNGTYVGGKNYTMAPNGTYVSGKQYVMAPDGSYVGGTSYMMTPDGHYVGVGGDE